MINENDKFTEAMNMGVLRDLPNF